MPALDQVQDQLADIQRAIGRLEGKVDAAALIAAGAMGDHKVLEKRVRGLEHRSHWYAGASAVVAFALAKWGIPLPLPK